MTHVNFMEVAFNDPVTIIAANCESYSNIAVEEFRNTKDIDVEYYNGNDFHPDIHMGYGSMAVARMFVKYISLKAEAAKIECSAGKFKKKIIIVDYTNEILIAFNEQEIPYYRPVAIDAIKHVGDNDDWPFETQINGHSDKNAYMHQLILVGLKNAGIKNFTATSNAVSALFRKVEKGFNHQDKMDLVYFIDSYGHLVARTIDPISMKELFECFHNVNIGKHIADTMACVHSPYMQDNEVIVFRRKDAEAITKAVDNYLTKENMTDIELFGDAGISYERLYDVANGLIFPLVAKNVPMCHWSYENLPSQYKDILDAERDT